MCTPSKACASDFDYDLFFSYATVDDEQRLPGREESSWVTYFRNRFVKAIGKSEGINSIKVFQEAPMLSNRTRVALTILVTLWPFAALAQAGGAPQASADPLWMKLTLVLLTGVAGAISAIIAFFFRNELALWRHSRKQIPSSASCWTKSWTP
jgi:hypothetical protein